MLKKIKTLISEVSIFVPKSKAELEKFRINYLGKKGVLNSLFADFKLAPKEEKKHLGKNLNLLKGFQKLEKSLI